MSLDEVAKECKEAAEYLASQPGEGYDLDTLMRDKNLEFEESLSKAEKRLIRANEIENLECLAAHLERLPRHCFRGNPMDDVVGVIAEDDCAFYRVPKCVLIG